jgi:hypothetical protein
MAFTTYQEVRRYATRIRDRTAIRDRMGAMPPFFVEPGVGIQRFKNDHPLSDVELATIQAWVSNGVPEGDRADMPPPLDFPADVGWTLGEPDLILASCLRVSRKTGTCSPSRSERSTIFPRMSRPLRWADAIFFTT